MENEKFVVMIKDRLSGNWDYVSDFMEYAEAQRYKWRVYNDMGYPVALMGKKEFKEWQENGGEPELYRKLS